MEGRRLGLFFFQLQPAPRFLASTRRMFITQAAGPKRPNARHFRNTEVPTQLIGGMDRLQNRLVEAAHL